MRDRCIALYAIMKLLKHRRDDENESARWAASQNWRAVFASDECIGDVGADICPLECMVRQASHE